MRMQLQYRASNNLTFVVTVNENYGLVQANCEASASLNWLRNEGSSPDDKFQLVIAPQYSSRAILTFEDSVRREPPWPGVWECRYRKRRVAKVGKAARQKRRFRSDKPGCSYW